jgi:D-alanine-D-alanine ligase
MKKPVIAFVTGGYSSEAVISYQSAITIEKNIDRDLFDVYRIDITAERWFHTSVGGGQIDVDKNDFSLTLNGHKVTFDAVLIGIHGTPGEDGKLQGYFDLLSLPYSSCDAATSAITFNKRYTCAIAGASGFNVSRSALLFKNMVEAEMHTIRKMNFPLFVKPNNGGSSIGISKVNHQEDLDQAIEKAFKEDNQVLVEEFIKGREFTIGVFKSEGKVVTLPITEIISENDFFDFEAKYQGKSTEITPANCAEEISSKVKNAAAGIYSLFNCNGVVRMDFIYNETENRPYLLEINTVPGQSAASIIPQQVAAAGMELKNFYSMLINNALAFKNR